MLGHFVQAGPFRTVHVFPLGTISYTNKQKNSKLACTHLNVFIMLNLNVKTLHNNDLNIYGEQQLTGIHTLWVITGPIKQKLKIQGRYWKCQSHSAYYARWFWMCECRVDRFIFWVGKFVLLFMFNHILNWLKCYHYYAQKVYTIVLLCHIWVRLYRQIYFLHLHWILILVQWRRPTTRRIKISTRVHWICLSSLPEVNTVNNL